MGERSGKTPRRSSRAVSGLLDVMEPGCIEYGEGLELQKSVWARVRRDPRRPCLVLLEHLPVFTLGKNADPSHILDAGGIPVVRTDRGGEVTYHGPGQLVGYPVMDLRPFRLGVARYVEALEEVLIRALRDFGVRTKRVAGRPGLWVGRRKIAAVGIRVDRGVTRHGFSLNVSNQLDPFRRIHPCGLKDIEITSMVRELGRWVDVSQVAPAVRDRFVDIFRFRTFRPVALPGRTVPIPS